MGYLRWMLLGNLGQQIDIEEQRQEIKSLKQQADNGALDQAMVDTLMRENKEMRLYIASLFRLMIDKQIISRDELLRLIDKIDAEDGKKDGAYDGDVTAAM